MPKFSVKLQKAHVFGIVSFTGIVLAMLRLSLAITAFTPQNQPIGYVAQDEVTNYSLISGTETLFRSEYKRDYWGGNLYAYPVDAAGNVQTGTGRWNGGAAVHIDLQNFDTGRYIATMKDNGTGIPFRAASLSATQQSTLNTTISGTAYTATQIVNFLRGDRSNEGASALRQRSTALGDIIHTRPYYIADATNPTVFVSANDGMLHAINTADGSERWAYVPSMLISKMKTLAYNPTDATQPFAHDYFADGQISIGNVTIGGTTHRILVGGLGAGGKGLYALDITDSAGLTAASDTDVATKVLWEITPTTVNYATPNKQTGTATTSPLSTAYSKLGYTYGTPILATILFNGAPMNVVIVGNGYNSTATGESYLYIINAATGALIEAVQAGSTGATNPNGILNVAALDTNADGYVDRVYAGDLNGTMWRFNINDSVTTASTSSVLLTLPTPQPITSTPGIGLNPNGGYMVIFGTGKAFTGAYGTYDHTNGVWTTNNTGDLGDTSTYYIYGVWDDPKATGSGVATQVLQERSYSLNGVTTRVRRIAYPEATANWVASGTKYWKVALPAGERVLGEGSFVENGRFYFVGYNPTVTPYQVPGTTTDIYGENWLMELNYLTGGSTATPFLDMNSDLILNNLDRIVYATGDTIPTGSVVGDPILTTAGIPVGKWLSNGVQSQPILVQLTTLNTTLFNQNPDVIFPPTATANTRGVAGGHFDVDNFWGANNKCSNVNSGGGNTATGSISFNYGGTSINPGTLSISIGGTTVLSGNPGGLTARNMASWVVNNANSSAYSFSRSSSSVIITANNPGTAYNATITVSITQNGSRFSYSISNLSGGTNGTALPYSDSNTSCTYVKHVHEYDKTYDKTGLNMLNASLSNYNLSNAISATTNFKVLLMNQYLNPAMQLNLNYPSYNPASSAGYVSVKNYQTGATLDITTVPTYNLSTVGSLVINMPVDAFSIKDWWGNGDLRAGVMSISPGCAWSGSGVGADMYQPVIPPADGVDGPGTAGTTTGARHGGAMTIQIIKDTTPQSAIEQNVAGRPEYGYRVNQANFYTYVLAEYIVYWHHPRNMCYSTSGTAWKLTNNNGDAWNTPALMTGYGWTKAPPPDIAVSTANGTPATGSTDPKLGTFGNAIGCTSTTTVSGNVTTTTTTCTDGTKTVIQQTNNNNGTVTVVTTNYAADGSVLSSSTSVVANASGTVKTGGDERGLQARTGRISWHELIRQ